MIRPAFVAAFAVLGVASASLAARTPHALVGAQSGAWDVSRSADGHNAARVCLADLTDLAQWEHRGKSCRRTIVSDTNSKAVIQYECSDGGFGRSDMVMLTPRTVRVDTQGISGGLPFAYQLHARRAGTCAGR